MGKKHAKINTPVFDETDNDGEGHNIKPIEYFTGYFANMKAIEHLTECVRTMEGRLRIIEVERKIDWELRLKQLKQDCAAFRRGVLFDLTQREIMALFFRYVKREPFKIVADKVDFSIPYTSRYCQSAYNKYKRKLTEYLESKGSK